MTDHTAFSIDFDPTVQYMSGRTVHGNKYFSVPFISHIGGNLYLGGCQDGLILPQHIKHVFSLYPWERYTMRHDVTTDVSVRMYDADIEPDRKQLDEIAASVDIAIDDAPTLVHTPCVMDVAGYFRSEQHARDFATTFGLTVTDHRSEVAA